MKRLCLLVLLIYCALCSNAQSPFSANLKDVSGKDFDLAQLKNNKGSVIVMLSPVCPICQKYTLTLNTLQKEFESKGIRFYGIIPGTAFKIKDIYAFAKKYKVTMPLLLDKEYTFTKAIGATVTPEVQLYSSTGELVYAGKVDNWYESIGNRRTVITEHYLQDAVNALLAGTLPTVKKTTPVGCFIF